MIQEARERREERGERREEKTSFTLPKPATKTQEDGAGSPQAFVPLPNNLIDASSTLDGVDGPRLKI